METWFSPAGDDDASNNRNERAISDPGLAFHCHEIREQGGEERRGGTDSLSERHRQIPQRNIATDDGEAEDKAEGGDLQELDPRPHGLQGHELEPRHRRVAEERACSHMARREEDRVPESVIGEEVFVEEKHTDVGGVPGGNEPECEEAPTAARRRGGTHDWSEN